MSKKIRKEIHLQQNEFDDLTLLAEHERRELKPHIEFIVQEYLLSQRTKIDILKRRQKN